MDMSFDVNNGRVLHFSQVKHDGKVFVCSFADNEFKEETEIPNGDFVMLYNFYRYIKDNDIYHDFINPNGKEVE